jgi:hypothetical protein
MSVVFLLVMCLIALIPAAMGVVALREIYHPWDPMRGIMFALCWFFVLCMAVMTVAIVMIGVTGGG